MLNSPARLLVVDDNALNLDLLSRRLLKEGYVVETAEDGYAALARLEAEPFDLALLDIMMPGLDGLSVLTRVRQARTLNELPIIMVTAKAESQDVVSALGLGANDYVTKPIDFPVLLARVRTHLRLKQAEDTIRRLALTDSLTGLPNRRLFQDRLERALALARRNHQTLAVFYLDVDKFKRINDTLGHDAGDAVIRAFGERVSRAVRQSDTVARLGGDEFVVLLPELSSREEAAVVALKIRDAVSAPLAVGNESLKITTSLGIATYPQDAADPDTLLKCADTAMYHAKQRRDAYCFYGQELVSS